MKKFLLSLATVLCMGSFASADEVTISFGTANGWTGTADKSEQATATVDGFKFTMDKSSSTNYVVNACVQASEIRIYKGFDFTIESLNGQQITAIKFDGGSTLNNMTVGETSLSWTNKVMTWEGNATSVTFAASGGQSRITKATITYVSAGAVVVETPTFSVAGGTYDNAQTVELSAAEGCTIYYTTDGQNPTDDVDDGSTIKYTAPITVDKTMTIKALAVDGDDNMSNIVSETYTIVELYPGAEGDGTKANPFNAAGAYNAALLGSTAEVYVAGTVVSISEISTSFGNATYYISADGTETNQFYIYRGYSLDGQKFTSEDELKVGDKVVVLGNLTTYKDVPQLANGNKLISINGEGGDPIVLEGEGTEANPFTVADVIAINPSSTTSNTDYPERYWINGYIVGYSSSASNALTPVFNADEADSQTNLILGPTPDCKDITLCVPVQLPAGKIRTELNLQDNPTRLGQEVSVYGNIYKYFSVPGIRNVSDYKLAADGIDAVEIDENAPVEYFNLQGVRVENPANGLYIMRQGDKVVKVIK